MVERVPNPILTGLAKSPSPFLLDVGARARPLILDAAEVIAGVMLVAKLVVEVHTC